MIKLRQIQIHQILISCGLFLGIMLGMIVPSAASEVPVQPPKQAKIWSLIRAGFQLNHHIDNPRVKLYLWEYYHHPELVEDVLKRAKPYLFMLYQRVHAKKLPTELVLLPFVESGYNNQATSGKGAQGLWQLMPATAARFGITEQSPWYDGRFDINQSTNAALNYLNYLRGYFANNWIWAIAAYNAGEGEVTAAIDYNRKRAYPTDFWNLPLPYQTRDYIPKLLAISAIIAHPDEYDITLPSIPDHPYLQAVHLKQNIPLRTIAKLAGLPLNTILSYNPAYLQWTSAPDSRHAIYIPTQQIEQFKRNLTAYQNAHPSAAKPATPAIPHIEITHQKPVATPIKSKPKPKPKIAQTKPSPKVTKKAPMQAPVQVQKTNTTYPKVYPVNPLQKTKIKRIETQPKSTSFNRPTPQNQIRRIAPPTAGQLQNLNAPIVSGKTSVKRRAFLYTIQRGDTLTTIADNFGVSVKQITQWNHIQRNDVIQAGQQLLISPP